MPEAEYSKSSSSHSKRSLERRVWDIRYNTELGIRYHMECNGFYERASKVTALLSLVTSGTAFVFVLSIPVIGQFLIAITAILQAYVLVSNVSSKVESHSNLYRDYLDLKKQIQSLSSPPGEDSVKELEIKRTEIEAREPAVKRALLDCVRNDANSYLRTGAEQIEISKFRKMTRFFF